MEPCLPSSGASSSNDEDDVGGSSAALVSLPVVVVVVVPVSVASGSASAFIIVAVADIRIVTFLMNAEEFANVRFFHQSHYVKVLAPFFLRSPPVPSLCLFFFANLTLLFVSVKEAWLN